MALYRYMTHLHKASPHEEFEKLYKPGDITAFSGIAVKVADTKLFTRTRSR